MSSSRTVKTMKNISFTFANQILMLVLSFVSRTIFIRVLGVEYLGISGLFADVLGLLSMADLGINSAMAYSFYKPLAEKDYKKMAALTSFYKVIYNGIAIVVTFAGLLVTPFLRNIVNLERDIPNLEIYYLLSLAGIVVSYLCVYKTSVIVADQNNYIVTKINMVINIVKTVLQIIFLLIVRNYIVFLMISVAANIINNLIASRKSEKMYPFIRNKEKLLREEKREIFNNIKSMVVFKLSSVMLNATDNILISTIVGTIAVGYYSNYQLVMKKINVLYTTVFSSMVASIGNLIVKENAKKRYEIFRCELSIIFLISGVVVPCYTILINDLIRLWLGKNFIFDNVTVIAIAMNMYLSCVLQPVWSYREATGMFRKTKWVMFLCACLNIVLSILLGYKIGIAGILFASSISRLLTSFWIDPWLLYRDFFERSSKGYFKDMFINFSIIVALIFGLGTVGSIYEVNNWIEMFIKSGIVFVICCLVTLGFYRKSEETKIMVKRISGIANNFFVCFKKK
ncbi:MAG: transporter [Lachnospiraceae bacterium]|nr:transporter [Lachnospiraceae bacterium]